MCGAFVMVWAEFHNDLHHLEKVRNDGFWIMWGVTVANVDGLLHFWGNMAQTENVQMSGRGGVIYII